MGISLDLFPSFIMNFADAIISLHRIEAFYSLSEVSHDVVE